MPQLFFGDIGQALEADFQICIGRDIIRHFAVIKLFVCHHIEVACAGQTEYNGLFLAGFLAFQCFINRYANGVRAFRMPSILANCSAASNTAVCSMERASISPS